MIDDLIARMRAMLGPLQAARERPRERPSESRERTHEGPEERS
ncbi:MAG TPA: hypothetical protein VEM58_09105 [Streptosporangiaceae bacterium]|nr:hypothetical protein [Streptosporangiaceae bacterium]